jgi:hypothetical protein
MKAHKSVRGRDSHIFQTSHVKHGARGPHAARQLLKLIDIKININILVEIFFENPIFQQPRRQEVSRRHKLAGCRKSDSENCRKVGPTNGL